MTAGLGPNPILTEVGDYPNTSQQIILGAGLVNPTGAVVNVNRADYFRIRVPRNMLVTIFTWVTGAAAAGNYDVGIYADTGGAAPLPGSALWRKGSTVVPAINTVVTDAVSPSLPLPGGIYVWLAFVADNAAMTLFRSSVPLLGLTTDAKGIIPQATLAASFPLPASAGAAVNGGISINYLGLREA